MTIPHFMKKALEKNICNDCGEPIDAHLFDDDGFIMNVAKWYRCDLGKPKWK